MKKSVLLLFVTCGCSLFACNGAGDDQGGHSPVKNLPKPGAIVANAEMPVDDPLNHFTFSVKVIADSNVRAGVYDIDADFGPNFASGQFVMPKGGEELDPLIRKGSDPYTYIIGFKIPGDTTFYDYFEVSSDRSTTKMRYIKAYTF